MKNNTKYPKIFQRWRYLTFYLLLTLIWSCHSSLHLTSAVYQRYELSQDTLHTVKGSEIKSIIAPYKSKVDAKMETVIGMVPEPLKKERIESTLGNWMADAIAEYVEKKTGRDVDLAICNYGGIRIPVLPAGPLTVGDIYELMPFDNYVVTMELKGAVLKQLLKRIVDYGGWPVSGSLRLEITGDLMTKTLLNGRPISLDTTYFVALSDYLANGGDRLDFLIDLPHNNLNVYYRDALIESAQNQKEITAKIEGRIKYLNN